MERESHGFKRGKVKFYGGAEMSDKIIAKGIVKSRICPQCGHHEIGIITSEGEFIPLRAGMYVQVVEASLYEERIDKYEPKTQEQEVKEPSTNIKAWLPQELRKNRMLRLRYGVIIKENEHIVDKESYKKAFIKKIQSLIEKETFPDLAITLDRFFHSPHLAAGNSAEITLSLIRDIDKIRRPLELIGKWLESKNKEDFSYLLEPFSENDLTDEAFSDEELIKELTSLTLEDFFKSLA